MRRILVTGADGLLGTALRTVRSADSDQWTFVGRERDFTQPTEVAAVFAEVRPTHVIHAAAKVGGFQKNKDCPEEMYYVNAVMNALVIHQAAVQGVEHFVGFGSNCAFAADLPQLTPEAIQSGEPYPNNAPYAYAKRMIQIHLAAAKAQHGMSYTYLVPPSMYGPGDNFSLADGHVVASLIHKCWLARQAGEDFIPVWGSGRAIREVAYSEDIARIVIGCLHDKPENVVVSSGQELSIKELAETICRSMGVREIRWQADKPDGQLRRPVAVPYPFPFTPFAEGVDRTCRWFQEQFPRLRS